MLKQLVARSSHTQFIETKMNLSRCPPCEVKPGRFLYADARPHCHEELDEAALHPKTEFTKGAKAWPGSDVQPVAAIDGELRENYCIGL
jgi:hypothetical protein